MKSKIAALILTYNEEIIIHKCIKALGFCDKIIVLDSYSTDNTIDVINEFNVEIYQRVFENYARQRNAAIKKVPKDYDWILMVDADEIVTTALQGEIETVINEDSDITMYRVRRKDIFQGKWVKQSSGYPTWFPRLFKNGCVKVIREINEEYETSGKIGHLQEHLIHYPFNKGISYWFEKHNRYSQMEAEKILEEVREPIIWKNLISNDPVIRRKAQKRFSYRLPFRPWLVFMAFYILKGGFLNGRAGYNFCKLRKTYEWMIQLKLEERNHNYS